jgi:hypothetical protein
MLISGFAASVMVVNCLLMGIVSSEMVICRGLSRNSAQPILAPSIPIARSRGKSDSCRLMVSAAAAEMITTAQLYPSISVQVLPKYLEYVRARKYLEPDIGSKELTLTAHRRTAHDHTARNQSVERDTRLVGGLVWQTSQARWVSGTRI